MTRPFGSRRTETVLVVGAGIAGTQAAIDLCEAGYRVVVVERASYTGGTAVRLDKTFPTNDCLICSVATRDCFLCIRSPRFIDYGRDKGVEVLTDAELVGLTGEPGNFIAEVRESPRYVDQDKCSACGKCAEVCPIEVADQFNEGFTTRKAIYRPHPQSCPGAYIIDPAACNQCGQCEIVCPEKCIDIRMTEKTRQLNVGAVILCPGFESSGIKDARRFGYGVHPDVVTSIEFERLISASGPTGGKLRKPSDGQAPKSVAWIQCVGSRDATSGQSYCSSICCMYAIKQAMLLREMSGDQAMGTIFGIDARVYGKGFERYFNKAQTEYGARFIRSRIYEVDCSGEALSIRYAPRAGEVLNEEFDMVVLSLGMCLPKGAADLAEAAGIALNRHGFCLTPQLSSVQTTRSGVFVAGAFSGPKNIPDTVAEASAAASEVMALLNHSGQVSGVGQVSGQRSDSSTNTHVEGESATPERFSELGVVLCTCGSRISETIPVERLADFARSLHGVAWVEIIERACSPEGQKAIGQAIGRGDVDRVVIAACSPRNYELLFRDVLRDNGLNSHMLEMANLLEHCSLVHEPGPRSYEKARDLLSMAIARARLLEPLTQTVHEVTPAALVVGGGLAGLTCASYLLAQGHEVYLIEKAASLGGLAGKVDSTLEGIPLSSYVKTLATRVETHSHTHVLLNTQLASIEGEAGSFVAHVRVGPRMSPVALSVGSVIVASGGGEYRPSEYAYGSDPRVVTTLELEQMIAQSDPKVNVAQNIVMIQCVGSRNDKHQYCSRVCCASSVKHAINLKEKNPDVNVYILYRDVVTYGLNEDYYYEARQKGVVFLRWDPANPPSLNTVVTEDGAKALQVTVEDPELGMPIAINADLLVLATAMVPNSDNSQLAHVLDVPLTADGFFQEMHEKLRTVEFDREAIFVCGLAHSPKSAREQIAQAAAAATKASIILSKKGWIGGAEVAIVDGACVGCLTCARVCPFGVPQVVSGKSYIDPIACKGCGICVVFCPAKAIRIPNDGGEQLLAQVGAWLGGVS